MGLLYLLEKVDVGLFES